MIDRNRLRAGIVTVVTIVAVAVVSGIAAQYIEVRKVPEKPVIISAVRGWDI